MLSRYICRSFSVAAKDSASPFLTSASLQPASNGSMRLLLRVPDLPRAEIRVNASDGLVPLSRHLRAELGVGSVQFLIGGVKVHNEAALVSSIFGKTLEIEIDRVRYSVNEGLRVGPTGAGVRPSAAFRTIALWSGGAALSAAIVAFWVAVLPEGHSRL